MRGIAIGLVMVHHCWFGPYVPGLSEIGEAGMCGVDVFFVLSGYLITGILLKNLGREGYYRTFYARRFLRIVPLYWGYLTLIMGPRALVSLLGGSPPDIGPAWVYYAFLSNLWFSWAGFQEGPVDITWSLCVEEQFYLLFPLVVAALPRRVFAALLIGVVVLSGPMRYLLYDPRYVVAIFTLTPLRADGLAIGALAAIAQREGIEAVFIWARRLLLPLTALVAIQWGAGYVGLEAGPLATRHATISWWSAALLLSALSLPPEAALNRALSGGALVGLGRVSYSLYLLHAMIITVVDGLWAWLALPDKEQSVPWALLHMATSASLSIAAATLTYRTIEQPLLAYKDRIT